MVKLKGIVNTDPRFWFLVGSKISNMIRNRVQKKNMNYKGQQFRKYSADYAEAKSSGEAKPRGASQASFSKTPDMTLTGKTMADLQVRKYNKNSVTYGWSGLAGGVVDSLSKIKNYQIVGDGDNVLHDKELETIHKMLSGEYEKNIKKYASKPTTIELKM